MSECRQDHLLSMGNGWHEEAVMSIMVVRTSVTTVQLNTLLIPILLSSVNIFLEK